MTDTDRTELHAEFLASLGGLRESFPTMPAYRRLALFEQWARQNGHNPRATSALAPKPVEPIAGPAARPDATPYNVELSRAEAKLHSLQTRREPIGTNARRILEQSRQHAEERVAGLRRRQQQAGVS